MKKIIYSLSIFIILGICIAGLPGCFSTSPSTAENRYSAPDWAPAYEQGVRYYYFPDIETYYDVSDRNFIYPDQGRWITSRSLSPMYSDYDLYNGYQVMLDRRVYEPWRYHQNYVSSYPRYYYRSMYGNQGNHIVRGYNENNKKPVYISSSDRLRNETNNSPSQINTHRQSSDRRVGKPVKVTPDMRQPSQPNPSGISSRRQNPSIGTGTGTSDGSVQTQRSTSTTPPPSVRRNERRNQQNNTTSPKGITNGRQNSSTETGTGTSNGDVQQQRSTTTTPPPSVTGNERRAEQDSKTDSKSSTEERKSNRRR